MGEESPYKKKTFMNYVLSPHQDAILNQLIPAVTSAVFYILILASDASVVFRHLKDANPIFAFLTLFQICFPSLISYMVIISSWELWPDMIGCGRDNFSWFVVKTCEHLLFPAWAMWRFAERIFWSIEASRGNSEECVAAMKRLSAPRSIELYFFLQAFLHSLPQMLLQLTVLMRQDYKVHRQTFDAEVLSFVFNLTKVAATVAFYQRFKTQKIAGRQYPWFKAHKTVGKAVEEPPVSESRRSSDFYLEPELRQASVDEPDFNIRRVASIKGLPEDDLAGKLVSFVWWSSFLFVRILAISTFFYFYPTATVWMMVSHVVVVVSFLVYDVKSDDVHRAKLIFFLFLGLVFIFCIIEFKVKFKKTKYMYGGFFTLVLFENFLMSLIWWFNNVEDLQNAFWFQYILFIVFLGSFFSVLAMILYHSIYKPEKVVVGHRIL